MARWRPIRLRWHSGRGRWGEFRGWRLRVHAPERRPVIVGGARRRRELAGWHVRWPPWLIWLVRLVPFWSNIHALPRSPRYAPRSCRPRVVLVPSSLTRIIAQRRLRTLLAQAAQAGARPRPAALRAPRRSPAANRAATRADSGG